MEAEIAKLNDAYRRSGMGFLLSPGVRALEDWQGLMYAVRNFNEFTEDNDPYGEHDFGILQWRGKKVSWKIDYYDQAMEYGCGPLEPYCRRLLTILLAEEY